MSNERDFEQQWTAFIFSNTYMRKELNAASGFNNSSGVRCTAMKSLLFRVYVRKRGKRERAEGEEEEEEKRNSQNIETVRE